MREITIKCNSSSPDACHETVTIDERNVHWVNMAIFDTLVIGDRTIQLWGTECPRCGNIITWSKEEL